MACANVRSVAQKRDDRRLAFVVIWQHCCIKASVHKRGRSKPLFGTDMHRAASAAASATGTYERRTGCNRRYRTRRRTRKARRNAHPWSVGRRVGAAVGVCDVHCPRRFYAAFADTRRGGLVACRKRGHGAAAAGGHRPRRLAGRAGTPDRTGGRTIARPDRRNLFVDRCGTGDPGCDRRQRDARPRP